MSLERYTVEIDYDDPAESSIPTVTISAVMDTDGVRHRRRGEVTDPEAKLAIVSTVSLNLPPKASCTYTEEPLSSIIT